MICLLIICLSLQELRESVQLLLTTKIAVYLMTFLIVTVAWAAHIRWVVAIIVMININLMIGHFQFPVSLCQRLFQVIVCIDDSLALLNLVSILALWVTFVVILSFVIYIHYHLLYSCFLIHKLRFKWITWSDSPFTTSLFFWWAGFLPSVNFWCWFYFRPAWCW